MGNCCATINAEESRYSISIDHASNSIDLQPLPIIKTESSSNSLILPKIPIKPIFEALISEKDTCAGIKEETSILTLQSPEECDIKCTCGSYYLYKADLVFWHYEKFGNWNIQCSVCLNYFSKSAWKCNHCDKIICRDCGNIEGMQAIIEYCENNHELIWSPNTCAYYSQEYNKSSYICGLCKRSRNEPSWACRDCEYDICLHCGIQKGLIPTTNLLICGENKPLLHYKKSDIPFICNKCNDITNKNSYSCSDCDFSLCTSRSEPLLACMIAHPGIKCKKNHDLKVIKIENVKKRSGRWYICLKCDNVSMKYGYLCTECCECYCLKCGDEIVRAIEKYSGRNCGMGHGLVWNPCFEVEDSENLCMVCWKRIYGGCFRCEDCGISVCVDDIAKIN
ncbi:hypothetical protein SteCoe_13648 [Stentor coeruleus]|uniref:Uncharacterized protein n=1 Tax=Stentor coeruleus TaxID=5963 RepID=A0A1R2C7Y7_9CILI|nr:hypothetical protein SteCoe_13648 [Stentor coeruleus]